MSSLLRLILFLMEFHMVGVSKCANSETKIVEMWNRRWRQYEFLASFIELSAPCIWILVAQDVQEMDVPKMDIVDVH